MDHEIGPISRAACILGMLAFLLPQQTHAQKNLLPYLSGNRYGLADETGRLVVQQDSLVGVVNGEGKMILPLAKAETVISCRQGEIYRAIDGEVVRYTLSGEDMGRLNSDKPFLKILNKNGRYHLADQYDTERTPPIYRQIFSNEDTKATRLIYFGRKLDKSDPFVDVINDYAQEITPEGFGLPESFTHSKTGENGAIVLVHKGDIISQKMPFRSGVINFEGEWIVPPDYQLTTIVGNELIRTVSPTRGTAALYSRYGQTLLRTPFEQLNILNRDSSLLQAQQNGNWGIIDTGGKVVIEPQFEKINDSGIPGIFTAMDAGSSYLITTDNRRTPIGPPVERVEVKKLSGSYFYTKLMSKVDGRYQPFIHVFDEQGNHFGDYSDLQLSARFSGELLPDGYMAVQKDKKSKPYVVKIETGVEFKQ